MFEEYAKDDYYARFNPGSYYCLREMHFTMQIYVKVRVCAENIQEQLL